MGLLVIGTCHACNNEGQAIVEGLTASGARVRWEDTINQEGHVSKTCIPVENLVVGAPCGLMDQMASVMGEKESLMALKCQPAQILPPVGIPAGLKLWGVDSGVRHSVGGQDYGSVRAAAFMGLKIISGLAQSHSRSAPAGESPQSPPPIGQGYLSNISPSEYRQFYEEKLPESLLGSQFLENYGGHWDPVTEVQADILYPVGQASQHPIMENFRVQSYRQALMSQDPEACTILGELMFQSHASYSRCGLGSEATDRLVALTRKEMAEARAKGQPSALHGAKITGGGSGGTVCILGSDNMEGEEAVRRVVALYSKETGGFEPTMLVGSSIGAAAFGCLRVRIRSAGLEPNQSKIDI